MEFPRTRYLNALIERKHNGMVKIVTGMRRCGKSYLLFRLFEQHLVLSGVPEDHIITLQLDSFSAQRYHDPHVLNDYIFSLIKDESMYYILLDEIQNVDDFESVLNGFLHERNMDCYVTGSNSRFLSSDIITEFRGRGDEVRVNPLSFSEYYEAVGGYKRDVLDEYLLYGGMPYCCMLESDDMKMNYLSQLYRLVYSRDLVERNRISDQENFDILVRIISSSVGSLTNPYRISNTFLSEKGSRISPMTLDNYIRAMEDAFLISRAQRYDVKGRKYISSPYKYYFSDLGIRNAVLGFRQFEKTHLMENLIYNELLCRGFSVDVGVVYKDVLKNNGSGAKVAYEVDFVATIGFRSYYIQSAYSIADEDKKLQEEKSLDNIKDSFQKVIITMDGNRTYMNDKGYLIMDLCSFLLDSELIR